MGKQKTKNKRTKIYEDDDKKEYIQPARIQRSPKVTYTKCHFCNGALKPKGPLNSSGQIYFKCLNCKRTKTSTIYKGQNGLVL